MELYLPILFGLHVICAQLYSLAETPQTPPPPRIWAGAIGQPRWTTSLCDPLIRIKSILQTMLVLDKETLAA